MKKSRIIAGLLVLCVLYCVFGCSDDKGSNSTTANLQGTWWYLSSSMDGVPSASFEDIANDEDAVAGDVIFTSNTVWTMNEYSAGQTVVYFQYGTCAVSHDTVIMSTENRNGTILTTPDVDTMTFTIASDVLTMTQVYEIMETEHTWVISFEKE